MVRPSPFEIRSTLEGDVARLTVVGELDIATAPQLESQARAVLTDGAGELIVDLSQLSFIDSSGLRLLIELAEEAPEGDWKLGLIAPPEEALAIFRITGADQNLPFIEGPPSP